MASIAAPHLVAGNVLDPVSQTLQHFAGTLDRRRLSGRIAVAPSATRPITARGRRDTESREGVRSSRVRLSVPIVILRLWRVGGPGRERLLSVFAQYSAARERKNAIVSASRLADSEPDWP
jgi:hypothetical protein